VSEPPAIVGNGMAAARLVDELIRCALARHAIAVIGDEPRLAYNRMLLSSVLAGETAPEDIELKPMSWWRNRGVTLNVGCPATQIDVGRREIKIANDESVSFSRLVLAGGSAPLRLNVPGADLRANCSIPPISLSSDPLDRLLGYIDFRSAIIDGPIPEFTCLLGTMVQEAYDTHPAIRRACDTYIGVHAAAVANDIEAAKALYAPDEATWSAESLALYTQAVLQGAFVLAKAKGGPEVARDCVAHLRRYLEQLFRRPASKNE
jgi:NADPH-dependent 2,4-dienoyl-CoA reductase/sulfur reductase-like enzyme